MDPAPIDPWAMEKLASGCVIPAHPLALNDEGQFDVRHQRSLTRYYAAAGAGGVAVGVHTTQFEIRRPEISLLETVLKCASETLDEIERSGGAKLLRIAGVCGRTPQALAEARLAREMGYHIALLSLAALNDADDETLIRHCEALSAEIPLLGFYLQPAVGGRRLGYDFWRRFAAIPNVVGVKAAPFNRYMTLDVIRGVAASGRAGEVCLYTGNDDNIVVDLMTRFNVATDEGEVSMEFVGGLLGHWAVWTKGAVEILHRARAAAGRASVPAEMLSLAAEVTDMNAALFDVANDFAGCIAGVQHVLCKQGLLASTRCLNPREALSEGQAEQIDRVRREYPLLVDDDFVAGHLNEWLD